MANGNRGQVKQIVLTVEYPDGSSKAVRMDPANVSKIILNPQGSDPIPEGWNTPDWQKNHAYIVVRNDGTVLGMCSVQSHPPPG